MVPALALAGLIVTTDQSALLARGREVLPRKVLARILCWDHYIDDRTTKVSWPLSHPDGPAGRSAAASASARVGCRPTMAGRLRPPRRPGVS